MEVKYLKEWMPFSNFHNMAWRGPCSPSILIMKEQLFLIKGQVLPYCIKR